MTYTTRKLFYFCSLLCLCLSSYSFGEPVKKLTVIYPDVDAPHDTTFSQIIQGIKAEFKGQIIPLKLPRNFDVKQASKNVLTSQVIILGKRGVSIANEIYQQKSVVIGALPLIPTQMSGVSLMASPTVLFKALGELAPQVNIINVVYSASSAWLIEDAKIVAKNRGYILKAILVDDLKMAVKTYNNLFEKNTSENVAIWLPLDPITINEKIILPTLLEKAWEKKIVVFSSKPAHAKRGALFSVLPDNRGLGKQLIKLMSLLNSDDAIKTSKNNNLVVVKPLNALKLAVNLRTASHLGYNYQPYMLSSFSQTFPK